MQNNLEVHKTKIKNIREIAPGVFLLSYPRTFQFIPGQVVGLTLDPNEPPRLYSIASGSQQDDISILFNVVPDGQLTEQLSQLKSGDALFSSLAFGTFYGNIKPAYWIATGTGIAPFLSMFHSGLGKGKIIIHGGRFLESFYFQDMLLKHFGKNYIRCCSKEKGDGIYNGRVTDYLKGLPDLPPDHKYYLCGSAEMVIETRDMLLDKGISFGNIIAEIYF